MHLCTMEFHFPVYLKNKNGLNYYHIVHQEHMYEYVRLGSQWHCTEIKAFILPDRLLILDLLNNTFGYTEVISAEEFEMAVK
jgi:hypothetical protein